MDTSVLSHLTHRLVVIYRDHTITAFESCYYDGDKIVDTFPQHGFSYDAAGLKALVAFYPNYPKDKVLEIRYTGSGLKALNPVATRFITVA